MTKAIHYINGNDFGEPRNWKDIEVSVDWKNQKEEATVSISELSFVLEAKDYLRERILGGNNGGVGIFEGEPYTIKLTDQNNIDDFVFNGYLDFTEQNTFIGTEEIICSLKKEQGTDWLTDVADSFSFAYLADKGIIKRSDYVDVPYVINYVPDGLQLAVLSMSIFMMTKELLEVGKEIEDLIGLTINASTPVVGVGAGLGAVAVTAWDLGDWIQWGIKTALKIVYAISIVIAIKKLIETLFEEILPQKRFHKGMTFRKMMQRGCQNLNLKFDSNIEELDWVYIPSKDKKGERKDTGHPVNSDPIYNFGDCIRILKSKFNADYRIDDGVFYFERVDNFKIPSSYKIPNFFNNQERLLDNIKFNTSEMVSNYTINFAYDTQDQNTLERQEGRVFQVITTPKITKNKNLVSIKNLAEIQVPFSLGRTKTELNRIEKTAKTLGRIVDNLTGIFGRGTNFSSKIQNRVGSLLLSSHFLTYPKVVKMNGSKLANNQRRFISAKLLWEKYHFINSFAEIKGVHNQYQIFEEQPVLMNLKQFNELLKNNTGIDENGNEFEIDSFVWNPESGTTLMNYRVRKKYTDNLKIEYIE